MSEQGLRLADGDGAGADAGEPTAQLRELHENRELERLFVDLRHVGLDISDYATTQEESVTGEKLPARFCWVLRDGAAPPIEPLEDEEPEEGAAPASGRVSEANGQVECPNLPAILEGLAVVGRRGLRVTRFKGLGEMTAQQLWDTTMDPTRRTMMRVTWDMASNADQLFSILMGEEVEPRRKFIEEHALEVKNLDV